MKRIPAPRLFDFDAMTDERARLVDVCLSVVLGLQLVSIFVSAPLAAAGLPLAYPISVLVAGALLAVIFALSPSRRAAMTYLLVIVLYILSLSLRLWDPQPFSYITHASAVMLTLGYATWLIGRATFAPGVVNRHRIGGGITIYFNLALMFSVAFRLVNELAPGSFDGVPPDDATETAAGLLLYFSIITLSTTGFGDITPASAVAHSLASLEAVVGQLYIATFLGRLITLNTTPASDGDAPG